GQFEAYDRGGTHPVLLDHRGCVTEGSGYNVFALVGDRLLTPESGALEGITRRTVLELATAEGIKAEPAAIPEETFRGASELFATSTAGGVMPIISLDGLPIGDGRPGPVTTLLRDRYWQAHKDPHYITPIDYAH
ncbi:MAG TPA: aminotransferase class IV, partial [Pseudonocardia sp.]|nr:aminotransferase class IV [Pseudonocardia sp.]